VDTPQIDDAILWLGAVAGAFIAIVAAMAVMKKWILGDVLRDLADVKSQLHRNSGSSLRDAVDRIEQRQTDIAADVRRVTERVDDHIMFHLEDK
jgi:hypothetical protein